MKQAALIALLVAACATAETSLSGPDPDGFDAGVEPDCPVQCGAGQMCEDDQCVRRTLYVAPAASDTAPGTRSSPISLEGALDKVEARNRIAIAAGHYTYFDVIRFPAGVLVEGGLDADTWEPTGGETRITIEPPLEMVAVSDGSVGVKRGVALDGVDDFTIRDLEIEVALPGAGAPMLSRGISVYGVHLASCDGWTLDNVVFRTGAAGDGATGSPGADGATGAQGAIGGAGDDDGQDNCGRGGAGGAGGGNATTPGPSVCARNSTMGRGTSGLAAPDPRAGGSGGSGGSGGADSGFDGASGGPGGVGGAGGPAGTVGSGGGHSGCDGGRDGTAGGPGDPGADGSPVHAPGDRASNFAFDTVFVPGGAAAPGGDGLGGSGGGGGGGGGGESGISCTDGAGSGGGGGGGGGQGGEGGRGGFGGGGAFGIYLHASTGTILGGALEPGAAGSPGVGGEGGGGGGGGPGSGGGPAHAGEIGAGGRGGDGGGGGRGGRGQDGAFGISVPLQCSDGTTSCVTVD